MSVPNTCKRNPDGSNSHPVAPVAPSVNVPFELTVRSSAELEVNDPAVRPPLNTKLKSLKFWITLLGLSCKFVRLTVKIPAPVENVAVADTGCPPTVLPNGVSNVMEAAPATDANSNTSTAAKVPTYLDPTRYFLRNRLTN